MTDKEIIKALECCLDTSPSSCGKCPLFNVDVTISKMICSKVAMKISLDLINRQQAEIENLKNILYNAEGVNLVNYWYQQCEIAENGCRNFEEDNKKLQAEIERLKAINDEAFQYDLDLMKQEKSVVEAEAIKEFARGLRQQAFDRLYVSIDEIDNLVKEMVGEDK